MNALEALSGWAAKQAGSENRWMIVRKSTICISNSLFPLWMYWCIEQRRKVISRQSWGNCWLCLLIRYCCGREIACLGNLLVWRLRMYLHHSFQRSLWLGYEGGEVIAEKRVSKPAMLHVVEELRRKQIAKYMFTKQLLAGQIKKEEIITSLEALNAMQN